ncbi:MAG: amino acid adenylation domain-containing protein [Lachnospiraceae bacterium]|nr:amino acid adenylation domain-containing protein [Lachnospiraceae bacterium]
MKAITYLDLFENTVSRFPEKTAVILEDSIITYRELFEKSKAFGSALSIRLQGKTRVPVCIFIDKGIECLIAMLGTVYSGNFYIPLDVKTPVGRLKSILDTLDSDQVICTERERASLTKQGYTGELISFEQITENHETADEDLLEKIREQMLDTDLMYIIFTSGSTGVPKGVSIRHISVLDYMEALIWDLGITSEDTIGNQTPFYADMSLKDIYLSFAAGATICIIPQTFFMSPKKLLNYMQMHQVTCIMWVPTAYRLVSQFDALSLIRPEGLKKFVFSGESMPISTFNYWKEKYPDGTYIQLYGPSEITGACTSYHVQGEWKEGETIPIGKAFRNTGLLLITDDGRILGQEETDTEGEICVYGTCLAAGYYRNPEKTREVFVQNPLFPGTDTRMYRTGDMGKWDAEGNLVFISRRDYQVKHGGKRIELGEIEAAVDEIAEIGMCCAAHNRINDELILYYTGDMDKNAIRERISNRLPKYMIPTRFVGLEKLPLLPNGKLDRKMMDRWANEPGAQRTEK